MYHCELENELSRTSYSLELFEGHIIILIKWWVLARFDFQTLFLNHQNESLVEYYSQIPVKFFRNLPECFEKKKLKKYKILVSEKYSLVHFTEKTCN